MKKVTHRATKLSDNPIGSWLSIKNKFAEGGSIIVIPFRSWKYTLLIVPTCWHYHLCACLPARPPNTIKFHKSMLGFSFSPIYHEII